MNVFGYKALVFILFLCSVPAIAQTEGEEDMYKRIVKLQDENEALKKEMASAVADKEKQIGNLGKQIDNLNKQIEKLKDKSEAAKADQKNARLSASYDSLAQALEQEKQNIVILKSHVAALQDSLRNVNTELASMQPFRKEFLKNKFKESDDYLKRPYSRIDLADLTNMKAGLKEYATDPEVAAAIQKLDKAIGYKGNVTDMTFAISSPFNAEKILKARDSFKLLSNNKDDFSPEQWKEFDNLDIYLSRYKNAVVAFQNIINETNKVVKNYGGSFSSPVLQSDCITEIKEVLEPFQAKDIPERINIIPYLQPRFENYYKWATSNPGAKPAEIVTIEEEILKLNPTY